MKLLLKQRFLSWFDSYDIYDENGNTVYVVKGQLAWGHMLKVYDAAGVELGYVKEKILTFLPKFEIYINNTCVGMIKKEFTIFKPKFNIDYKGWKVTGDFLQWNYEIFDQSDMRIATISKEIFKWTDTYVIDVADDREALNCLMFVLAMDAEKCSRS